VTPQSATEGELPEVMRRLSEIEQAGSHQVGCTDAAKERCRFNRTMSLGECRQSCVEHYGIRWYAQSSCPFKHRKALHSTTPSP
jgi:hypothetical protein